MAAAAAVPLPGDDEGISLHFKDSMFEQVHVEHIRFADYASACVPPSAAAASRKSQSLTAGFVRRVQGRLEGAILALLRHKPSQRVLLVSNTHLYWSPDYPDVKAAQASILCAAIASLLQQQQQRLQAEGEQQEQEQQQQKQGKEKQPTQQQQLPMAQRVPVVCAGDFNSLWRKYESDRWDQVRCRGSGMQGSRP
jgi:CCR4-NOT transcription complex subunit 6